MARPLYNRYVPPKANAGRFEESDQVEAVNGRGKKFEALASPSKRKRNASKEVHFAEKESRDQETKRRRVVHEEADGTEEVTRSTSKKNRTSAESNGQLFGDSLLEGSAVNIDQPSIIAGKESDHESKRESEAEVDGKKKKKKKPRPSEIREARERAEKEEKEKARAERAQKLAVREKNRSHHPNKNDHEEEQAVGKKKHSRVFDRFHKAAEVKADLTQHRLPDQAEDPNTASDQPGGSQLRDLEPIPMPEVPEAEPEKPTYASLPEWLSEPVKIPSNNKKSFTECHINSHFVSVLSKNGFEEALPLQAGVLPILIPSHEQHPGDSLISALTGSGKTLSYVLPIVQSILQPLSVFNLPAADKPSATEQDDVTSPMPPKLRAVIVLPTRELVAQVENVIRVCATGSRLKIGTALGSKNLKLEADSLVQKGMRYSPDGWERLRSKFDIGFSDDESDESEDSDDRPNYQAKKDRTSDAGEFIDLLPYHIPEYSSKVDVLVCTPGRLVEHIKTTPGFKLAHLEWLVIDEADQLLNQGFQEWVRTVLDAIEVDHWCEKQSEQLGAGLFQDANWQGLRRKYVRKILLSATMTRDLEKLSSLKLRSPKLILMEGQELANGISEKHEVPQDSNSRTMTIPTTLEEKGVPVGDGSEKPLYLLAVLKRMLEDTSATRNSDANASVNDNFDKGSVTSDQKIDTSSSSSESSSSEVESDDSVSDEEMLSPPSSDSNSQDSSSSSSRSQDSSRTSSPLQATGNLPSTGPQSDQTRPLTILIFTSNSSSASRLQYLLRALLSPDPVLASSIRSSQITSLTKTMRPSQRRKLLSSFSSSASSRYASSTADCRILISTDLAARGLDIPYLSAVISYDIPNSAGTYVHRVGRTARAGRQGRAWTLVADREAGWFWKVVATGKDEKKAVGVAKRREEETIERAEGNVVKRVRVDVEKELARGIKEAYAKALGELKSEVLGSKKGEEDGDV